MVDSAPETLNTLKELSDALGNDENFATTVATQIGNLESSMPTKMSDLDNDPGYIAPNDSNQLAISASTVTISGGSVAIGDTTYGFSVSNNKIENVGTPEASTDAATKGYVDSAIGNIETALDNILSIQNSLIGGDTE